MDREDYCGVITKILWQNGYELKFMMLFYSKVLAFRLMIYVVISLILPINTFYILQRTNPVEDEWATIYIPHAVPSRMICFSEHFVSLFLAHSAIFCNSIIIHPFWALSWLYTLTFLTIIHLFQY